ncbi:Uncharacterised protein [Vibrio cholerae]|nr:Uncharacterised protein [Vibrio cholerae]
MGKVTNAVRSNESNTRILTSPISSTSPTFATMQRSCGTPHPSHKSTQACGPMNFTCSPQFCSTAAATLTSMWSA